MVIFREKSLISFMNYLIKTERDMRQVERYRLICKIRAISMKVLRKGQRIHATTNTKNENYTLEEYKAKVKDFQTDKNDNLVYLYSFDSDRQHSYVQRPITKDTMCSPEFTD
jgi:hypothetical protein